MAGSRRNITRLALLAALGLCVALAGCSAPTSQPVGGSTNSKAEKARKEAEALALKSVVSAADAQAQAIPDLAKNPQRTFPANVVVVNDPTPPKTPPPSTPAPKATPPAPAAPAPAPATPAPAQTVAKGPPTPKSPLRPGSPPVFRERVVSLVPYTTEAEAEEDALTLARELVERKLAALDPPVRYKPTAGEITEFLRKESRTVRSLTAEEKEAFDPYFDRTDNLVFVEYDVEVTADQVRELRAQDRVAAGMRILGILVALALSGFLFLRADEWTKGYLTRWLAFAAVILAGGAAAAMIFV